MIGLGCLGLGMFDLLVGCGMGFWCVFCCCFVFLLCLFARLLNVVLRLWLIVLRFGVL